MKSRFLFAPIPILIISVLLGLDFWTEGYWGIYLLITITSASCMYEMGAAYSSSSVNVPFLFLTGGMVFLMLASGYVFLFPQRLADLLSQLELEQTDLTFFSFLFPLLLVTLSTVFYRMVFASPENTDGLLIGLGLFSLFSVTYLHAYVLISQFLDRPRLGTLFIIFLLLVSKGADSGSYIMGKTFGSLQMTPNLSPNKTWMGLLGGLMTGVLIGGAFYNSRLGELASFTSLLIIAFLIALSAAGGDLVGSLLKRGAGVNDSSSMFPGLGGMMDMTDSFLVSIPVALLIALLLT